MDNFVFWNKNSEEVNNVHWAKIISRNPILNDVNEALVKKRHAESK